MEWRISSWTGDYPTFVMAIGAPAVINLRVRPSSAIYKEAGTVVGKVVEEEGEEVRLVGWCAKPKRQP